MTLLPKHFDLYIVGIKGYKATGEEICDVGNECAYIAYGVIIRKKVGGSLESRKVGFFSSHFLFCFSVFKPHFEVHMPHSDTMDLALIVLFCDLISFYKF